MNAELDIPEEFFDDEVLMEEEFIPLGGRTFSHDSLFGNTLGPI